MLLITLPDKAVTVVWSECKFYEAVSRCCFRNSLGLKCCTDQDKETMPLVLCSLKTTAVESCYGAGKSFTVNLSVYKC